MIHRFIDKICDADIPASFTYPYYYKPDFVTQKAAECVMNYIRSNELLQRSLDTGKMLGVLVVRDYLGEIGFISAYSGQLDALDDFSYFTPPIFDYLSPNGYFKHEEACISRINSQINQMNSSQELRDAIQNLEIIKRDAQNDIEQLKLLNAQNKKERNILRQKSLSPSDTERLIKQSQFDKAELKRTERKWHESISIAYAKVEKLKGEIDVLKAQRKRRSAALQYWLFEQFVVLNANGDSRTLNEIFAQTNSKVPPAGAGECAAPKLLQYAYIHNLQPLRMAEFWWGASPDNEVRHQGFFYPSCRHKCEPILDFMLQGLNVEPNPLLSNEKLDLEIVYDDQWLTVVNKPAGMLSVPGKESYDSVQSRLQALCHGQELPVVAHRLDMHTSGLLIVAKDKTTLSHLHRQFENRSVVKRYIAILEGIPQVSEGVISLPLCLNIHNAPEQIVNHSFGKEAITQYKVIGEKNGCAIVEFYPITGRTHQLRVHASHKDGLNCPIVGDSLYGKMAERLMLHSEMIEFKHPATGKTVRFEIVANF